MRTADQSEVSSGGPLGSPVAGRFDLVQGFDPDRRDRIANPKSQAEREEDDGRNRNGNRPVTLLEQDEQEPGPQYGDCDTDQTALGPRRILHAWVSASV